MRMLQRLAASVLAAVLALSAAGVLAQRGRGRGQGGPVPPGILARLNLNDDQKAKVQAAGDTLQAERQKLRELSTPQERRQAGQKAMEDYRAAVSAALNPEQQKQLMGLMEEARQYGPMGLQLVALTPPLTDEQKTKIKEIGAKYQPEIQKLREEQRTATDRQAVRQQLMDTNRKMREEVITLLTDDQKKYLRDNAPQRRNQ